jgi:hypothetical protein
MYGGLGLLAGSYLVTALLGVGVLTGPSDMSGGRLIACMNCRSAGPRMMIPLAGPWLALPDISGGGQILLVLLGVAQTAGLAVTIGGIVKASSPPPVDEPEPEPRPRQARSNGPLSFGLLPTQNGAFGFASGRF